MSSGVPTGREADPATILARSFLPKEQTEAREALMAQDGSYHQKILRSYLTNPFLRLTDEEVVEAKRRLRPQALGDLIAARHAATGVQSPRYIVFCMPKSGSSFVQSSLQHALQTPVVSLTSFGTPGSSSQFGMNSREQELDELALVKSILASPDGFVAQHHTRYSPYLALQMQLFGLTPIVTVRNVLDCIVSFDDMMLAWRGRNQHHRWVSDTQFALPLNYEGLSPDDRYTLLGHSFGIWLIGFYLSWKRSAQMPLGTPLMIRYEDHVLNPAALVEALSTRLSMSDAQRRRLEGYAARPDRDRSRFNVGRQGRGRERAPERLKHFLADHAAMFRPELDDADIAYLVE